MTCGYCKFSNSDEDHRCGRCGRRLSGTVRAAPPECAREHVRIAVRAIGANALAAQAQNVAVPQRAPEPAVRKRATEVSFDTAQTLDALPKKPAQPSLFGAELQPKIIPFEAFPKTPEPAPVARQTPGPPAVNAATVTTFPAEPKPEKARRAPKPSVRRDAPEETQTSLDFVPAPKNAPRTLKTKAEAVIFCDAAVAAPVHRATAAALDLAMIVAAFGAVLLTFQFAHPGVVGRPGLLALGALFALTAAFYGLLFAITGAVTPGLHWTHLRLINFDGFTPDWKSRLLRVAGCWVSVLSAGLGIFWSLLDEESLTWHDHISNSFPTLRESESIVVRHQPR